MELTELLAGAAAMAIMGVQSGAAGTTSDYLISDLIMGKLTDPGAIQTRMDFAGWSLDRYKYLLVVRWEGDDKRMTLRDAFQHGGGADRGQSRLGPGPAAAQPLRPVGRAQPPL